MKGVDKVAFERILPPLFGKERGLGPVPFQHGTGFFMKGYYLFNTQKGSSSISLENDLLFTVGDHEGVGVYLPEGSIFVTVYWATKTQEEQDLFLICTGFVLGDYIIGWGLSVTNYQLTNTFLFFGHSEEI